MIVLKKLSKNACFSAQNVLDLDFQNQQMITKYWQGQRSLVKLYLSIQFGCLNSDLNLKRTQLQISSHSFRLSYIPTIQSIFEMKNIAFNLEIFATTHQGENNPVGAFSFHAFFVFTRYFVDFRTRLLFEMNHTKVVLSIFH